MIPLSRYLSLRWAPVYLLTLVGVVLVLNSLVQLVESRFAIAGEILISFGLAAVCTGVLLPLVFKSDSWRRTVRFNFPVGLAMIMAALWEPDGSLWLHFPIIVVEFAAFQRLFYLLLGVRPTLEPPAEERSIRTGRG